MTNSMTPLGISEIEKNVLLFISKLNLVFAQIIKGEISNLNSDKQSNHVSIIPLHFVHQEEKLPLRSKY